jgi:transposase
MMVSSERSLACQLQASSRNDHKLLCGIDVSLEESCICVIDATGKVVRESKVSSEPKALITWLTEVAVTLTRIGLEAGPLSQWLYAAMRQAGLAVELLETRHVRNAFRSCRSRPTVRMHVGLPNSCGWAGSGRGPGDARHADRAQTGAEELLETESSLRGIPRGFGLKVGKTTPVGFEGRIRELVAGHPTLEVITSALLSVRAALRRQFDSFEKRLQAIARTGTRARLLMTTPGVGVIVALTFACAIDDPSRFKSSKAVGACFGMTPTRYQSGETDYSGRISKHGDDSVRAVLYEAGHVILTRPLKGCTALKSWAMRIAKRAGMKKAAVALARKLAVIMHRMLADGTPFTTQPA